MQRVLSGILFCVLATMAAVFVYGLIFYTDAPIHPCGNGFCGKWGHPHTAAEYHAFLTWQATFLATWAVGLFITFGVWVLKRP